MKTQTLRQTALPLLASAFPAILYFNRLDKMQQLTNSHLFDGEFIGFLGYILAFATLLTILIHFALHKSLKIVLWWFPFVLSILFFSYLTSTISCYSCTMGG